VEYIMMYSWSMSRRYSIAEARSRLPSLLDEAEAGIEVELTRRGRPVAVLVSRREFDRLRGTHRHFSDAYKRFVERHSLKKIGVDSDFTASIRDRTPGRKVPV
jgi:prevent-host-death family protein